MVFIVGTMLRDEGGFTMKKGALLAPFFMIGYTKS